MTFSINKTLSLGETSNEVGELQTKLKSLLYYEGNINNKFDIDTLTSVKRFQYNNKITTDGIVGDNTWFLINNQYSKIINCDTNKDIHIVKKGETLYSIAKDFNLKVEQIKEKNKLESNLISIGQELII